jgi:hypothetical protein
VITATGSFERDFTYRISDPRREYNVVSPDPTKVIQSMESGPWRPNVDAISATMSLMLKKALRLLCRGLVRPNWQ